MITVKGRELIIPKSEQQIGTPYDNNSEVRHIRIDRVTSGGIDIANLNYRLDLEYANEVLDTCLLDKEVQDDYILLTWTIPDTCVAKKGTVWIAVRAYDESGTIKWATNRGAVYVGHTIFDGQEYTGKLSELEQLEERIRQRSETLDNSEAEREEAERQRKTNEEKRLNNETEWQHQAEAAIREANETVRASAEALKGAQQQAGIATEKAEETTQQASAAQASAIAAAGSADIAGKKAGEATQQASAAQVSATAAAGSADIAGKKAGEATQQASVAQVSATAAAESADTASKKAEEATQQAGAAQVSATAAAGSADTADKKVAEATKQAGAAQVSATAAEEAARRAEEVSVIEIATVTRTGVVKPDGATITVDADGTIHGAPAINTAKEIKATDPNGLGSENVQGQLDALTAPVFDDSGTVQGITGFNDFLGRIVSGMNLKNFFRDLKAGLKFVLHTGQLVNNGMCNVPGKYPLDAAYGKTLLDMIGNTSNLPDGAADVVSAIVMQNSNLSSKANDVDLQTKIVYEGVSANLDVHMFTGTLVANRATLFGKLSVPVGKTILAAFVQPIANVGSVINLYVSEAWDVYGYSNAYSGGIKYFCAIVYK